MYPYFLRISYVIHIINTPYNNAIQYCPRNSDRVSFAVPWTVYYKTLKEHKTVLYWVFEDINDIRSLKLLQGIFPWQLVFSISVWEVWRQFYLLVLCFFPFPCQGGFEPIPSCFSWITFVRIKLLRRNFVWSYTISEHIRGYVNLEDVAQK